MAYMECLGYMDGLGFAVFQSFPVPNHVPCLDRPSALPGLSIVGRAVSNWLVDQFLAHPQSEDLVEFEHKTYGLTWGRPCLSRSQRNKHVKC